MAYEKQEWKCGDTVTADKLNHMENGIESANSGGGTVEAIKIFSGTVNFGADTNFSGGGGLFLDGKTFGELIGDKKVVNFVTRGIKTASSSSAKPVSVLVQQIGEKDFIVDQDDPEIRNATGTGFHFCRYVREDALSGNIDVYAICI